MPGLQDMLLSTDPQGWIGCAAAIGACDFYTTTAALTLPTLVIAGANDGTTPPDLVRETADLILGHRFALLRGAGHLPMLEQPQEFAELLRDFLRSIGHVLTAHRRPGPAPGPPQFQGLHVVAPQRRPDFHPVHRHAGRHRHRADLSRHARSDDGCDPFGHRTGRLWGGIITASFAVMQFLFGPVVGNLSDRFGRRPILLFSLAVMALDYVVMAVTPSILVLLVARCIAGIASATHSTANAYVADITAPEDRGQAVWSDGGGVWHRVHRGANHWRSGGRN